MQQPEHYIQNEIMFYLQKLGYQVLRVGQDGLPDLIAVHPHSRLWAWHLAKPTEPHFHFKPTRVMFLNPSMVPFKRTGIFFTQLDASKWPNLFIEVKVPGGIRSPRQEFYIRRLSVYGKALFAESVDDVKKVLNL